MRVEIKSGSHGELINAVWEGLGEEGERALYGAVKSVIEELSKGGEGEGKMVQEDGRVRVNFTEVVRAGWSLGFHAAMTMMEEGNLLKITVKPGGEQQMPGVGKN